jgi:hypothetical protein
MKFPKEVGVMVIALLLLGSLASFGKVPFAGGAQVAAITGAGSGLVAYYPFDDGTATDQSGNGNNGTLTGGVAPVSGIISQAMNFDGVTGKININAVAGGVFTISLWINPTSEVGTYGTVIGQSNGNGLSLKSVRQLSYFETGDHVNSTLITNGSWQHVVVVSTGSSIMFYINGVLDATRTYTAASATFTSIGNNAFGEKFQGLIDDVRIYNRVLDTTDIAALYALGSGGGGGGGTPTPVNGTCGVSTNQCTAGNFLDQTDSGTQNLWQCTGTNGGTTASCSSAITVSPVNGSCGVSTNQCTAGTFNDLTDTGTQNQWQCLGANGGSNSGTCSSAISGGGGGTPTGATEIMKFNNTTNPTSGGKATIHPSATINSGTTAVILFGFEADSTINLSSVTDSKGNTWVIQHTALNNSVHRIAVMTAYMSSSLTPSDSIFINWSNTAGTDYAGDLLSIAAGDSSNNPSAKYPIATYNDIVTIPGTVPANSIIVGLIQAQNPASYSGSNWTVLGTAQLGVSGSTIGLMNVYLTTTAANAGTQSPGGSWAINESYLGVWLAFAANGSGGGGGNPTPVNGVCSTTTKNICTAGNFSDQTDTSSNYLWQCTGTNGGSTSSCTLPIPPTNGVCSATLNQCTAGTLNDIADTSTNYQWQCTGLNGGTTAPCTQAIPQTPPTTGTYYIDFVGGADTNAGTQASPWKHSPGDANATGNARATALAPGNTVIFKGGVVYSGEIDIPASGTASGGYITFRGNTPSGTWGTGKAQFDLLGTIQHAFYGINRSYINIDNVDIYNAQNQYNSSNLAAGKCPAGQAWVTRNGVDQCIAYNGVDNVWKGFITVKGGSNWNILNSSMHEVANYTDLCVLDAESQSATDASMIITPPADNAGINLYGTSGSPVRNVLIDSVEIFATGRDLMDLAYVDGIEIRNSDFGGTSRGAKAGWFAVAFREGETLGVKGSGVPSVWIHDNSIHDGWQYEGDEIGTSALHPVKGGLQRCHAGDWIHSYGTSGNVVGLKIERNFMYNNHTFNVANGTGNSFIESNNYDVSWLNNVIVNAQHVGIKTAGVQNMTIQGNTIITWPMALSGQYPNIGYSAPVYVGINTLTPTNVHIKNNVFVTKDPSSNTNPLEFYDGINSIPIEEDYNMYDSASPVSISVQKGAGPNAKTTFTLAGTASLTSWRSIFPTLDQHSVDGKNIAQFVSSPLPDPSVSGTGDYRPLAGTATAAILNGSGGSTPSPINGICGTVTANVCTSGSFSDLTDTGTNALWQCVGSLGGTTASCSLPLGTAYKPGDFNKDGAVNSLDYSGISGAWNTSNTAYDLNGDHVVNTLDFAIMALNWTP